MSGNCEDRADALPGAAAADPAWTLGWLTPASAAAAGRSIGPSDGRQTGRRRADLTAGSAIMTIMHARDIRQQARHRARAQALSNQLFRVRHT